MNVRAQLSFALLLLASVLCAAGQAVAPALAQPPVISDSDKAFAASLAAMPLDQAKAAIAQAPATQVTLGAAWALRKMGEPFMAKQPELALPLFVEALDISTRVGDRKLSATMTYLVGNAYRFSGNADEALASYNRAEPLYVEADLVPDEMGRLHTQRAVLRMDAGDLDGAVDDGNKAIAEFRQAGDDAGIARALNNLGNAELAQAKFTQARQHYEEGLVLARKSHQRLGEAYLLNNIANTYLQEENPLLATEYCLQAIKIKEEVGNKDDLVSSVVNLARIYQHSGRMTEALQTVQRASDLASETHNPTTMSVVLAEWGSIEAEQKHYTVALGKLREGYALTQQVGDQMHGNDLLVLVAEVELDNGQYADAVRDGTSALEFARLMGFEKNAGVSSGLIGMAQKKLGKMAASRIAFEESIAAVERLREDAAGGDQAAALYFSHQVDSYQALTAVDVAQGLWEQAFVTSERQKGRTLLDVLTRGGAAAENDLTVDEKNQESILNARVAKLSQQKTSAALEKTPDAARLAALDRQLKTAHDAVSVFHERVSAAHPDAGRHRGEAALITLAQTAELLPSRSTAVLEYEVTEDATYLFVLTRGPNGTVLHGYTIGVGQAALGKRIGGFHTALMSRDPGFAGAAASLYQLLVGPAAKDLAGKRRLIIVPSGELWHLPFQALQDSAKHYLIDDFSVSFAPSLSVLRAYAARRGGASGSKLVAFGDPANDLPEAAHEVEAVADLYGRTHSTVFVRGAATLANYRVAAVPGEGQEILLATHGVYDDHSPMDSYLVLASGDPGKGKTVQLDAGQIAATKIKARLVVLSACDTAEGKYEAGEGLIGLGWSFLAAGSESAVASQWRVESASTTELMIAFHRGLRQNMGRAAALRSAEMTLARDPRYRHPFYWAGFVLLGND
ncbi:MAG TPA: CHAT domain-containing protein [Acidobacteriaceae bacterium]|nr:CHAT domain-containing protein [Acidobacteriaceae bacterium]